MEQKICLDTDVVISILNNEERAQRAIDKIEKATVFITTITLFELLLRKTNLEAIEAFRSKVSVLEFTEDASRKASAIFKDLKNQGRITDIRDIFIAAICTTTRCTLLTFNTKHFEHVKELEML